MGCLVITRMPGQRIRIGENIIVKIGDVETRGKFGRHRIKVLIDAPRDIPVVRLDDEREASEA